MVKQMVVTGDTKPVPHTFADLAVGDRCTETLSISEETLATFINLSEDTAPVHLDEVYAREKGFTGRVVHGFLVTLRFSRLLGMFMPGPLSLVHSVNFGYIKPVMIGDELRYSVMVKRFSEAARAVVLDLEVKRAGEICVKGTGQCILVK